jgi:hypothetical protein
MCSFEFTLIVPSSLAPHDWHHNGKVTQELFAEVEGQPASTSSFSLFGGSRSGQRSRSSASTNRGSATPGYMSPRSPALSSSPPNSPLALSPMLSATASLSITRQEEIELPSVPSYEQSQLDHARPLSPVSGAAVKVDDWVTGTKVVSRNIMAIHNPSRAGGSSDLDERQSGFASGIGVWDLKIFSDVVCRDFRTYPSITPADSVSSLSAGLFEPV